MKLYKISQNKNNQYDTYDAFVVCAENEDKAKLIRLEDADTSCGVWVKNIKDVKVEYLGEAREGLEEGEILGSFNAG